MSRARALRVAAGFVAAILVPHQAGAAVATYLYTLSDFSGPVPYDDVNLYADRRNDEAYAAVGNSLRVFNSSGMEIYAFDIDPRPGTVFDVAVDESGDILLLTLPFDPTGRGPGWFITRCDYRGRPIGRIDAAGMPEALRSFRPNRMFDRGGRTLLVSLAQFEAVEIDRSGKFLGARDLAALVGMKDSDRARNDIASFSVDDRGDLLLSIPTMFKVVLIPPDGHARAFGHPGSSPGSFGNVAGVVADDRGNVIVADKARGVVMAFDQRFELVGEFGSGDDGRRALTRPTDLVLGASGKLYVTQARERGVAVYKLEIGGATAGREQERPIRVEKIARARGTTITNGPREHDSGPADGPPGRDEGGDGGTNVAVSNNGSSLWEEP